MASQKPDVVPNKSDLERLAKAQDYKTDGNNAYKEKQLRTAIGKYHRGLLQLKGLGQPQTAAMEMLMGFGGGDSASQASTLPPDLQRQVVELQSDFYNNLAGKNCVEM
jgi:hypothetical protein